MELLLIVSTLAWKFDFHPAEAGQKVCPWFPILRFSVLRVRASEPDTLLPVLATLPMTARGQGGFPPQAG